MNIVNISVDVVWNKATMEINTRNTLENVKIVEKIKQIIFLILLIIP